MSIASRIESIEEHIGNAYDSIEALGVDITGVNKNIENISTSIDGIFETLPKVTGEGESITLDGTIKGRLKSTLKGNTSQNGTPTPSSPIPVNVVSGDNSVFINGKNYLDNSNINYDYSNVANTQNTLTTIDTGIRYVTTSTGNPFVLFKLFDLTNFKGKTIRFRGTFPSGQIRLVMVNSDCSTRNQVAQTSTSNTTISFVVPNDLGTTPYLAYGLVITGSVSQTVDFTNLIITIDNEDTTYEPYTGATYPINLPVENLLGLQDVAETTTDGIAYSVSNGELSISGTKGNSGNVNIPLIQNVTLTSGITYTYSGVLSGTLSKNINVDLVGGDTRIIGTRQDTLPKTGSSYSGTATTIRLYIPYGTVFTDFKMKLQLSLGSKANSYTSYGTTPIELCKIGDYQDYFYKDSGKWYLHKEVGKVVLDGSELGWQLSGGTTNVFQNNNYFIGIYLIQDAFCNYYTNVVDSNIYANNKADELLTNGQFTFRDGATKDRIYFKDTRYTSINDFKNFLSTNTPILYFVLSTPTKEEITYQPLIEQLNNLEKAVSYNGQTNISQVNNDLPFIISASALKEWQESNVSTLSMVNPLSLGNTLDTQENDIQPIEVDNIEPLEEGNYEES